MSEADLSHVQERRGDGRSLGLMGRALLILILFNRAAHAELLSLESPGMSIGTTVYLGALLVMVGSLVLFWRNSTNELGPTGADLNPAAARRVYGLFSEPWYEVPAVSCMLLAGVGFISNLVAAPPESTRAKWFLASFVLVVPVAAIQWIGNRARRDGKERLSASDTPEAGWPRTGPLADRAFRMPVLVFALLGLLHEGVARIDAEPSSILAWGFFVAGPAFAITAVVSSIQNLRRKAQSTS